MYDLDAINSASKYPSIPTYHALGERGALTENRTAFTGEVILTEKVDGTSSRIVRLPDGDWFIGSREELLSASGDRVPNRAQGIVAALRPIAERLAGERNATRHATVYYLETYGAQIGAHARQYTGTGAISACLFDMAFIPVAVLDWPREQISRWRKNTGPAFATETVLKRAAAAEGIALTPRLGVIDADSLPRDVEGTYHWLGQTLPATRAALDAQAGGRPEGIVLRTPGRSVIAKARLEDYARTLDRRAAASAPAAPKATAEAGA